MMFEPHSDFSTAFVYRLGTSVESPNPQTPSNSNMSGFPTPPSSSGDSPQPIYFVASPGSNNFIAPDLSELGIQARIVTDTEMMNTNMSDFKKKPRLVFIEQPTNKFRFRYRSEMAGTHGSLCGISSDKSRKQTYPAVELQNCSEKAVVRCSIYQHNVSEDFKPHPHRLIMKRGRDEYDDPHNLSVGPEEGFMASFHSMGIIHTARKNIVTELVRKLTQLKREQVGRLEGQNRDLTTKEMTDIKSLAEQESKSINLNQVVLRFDAFIVNNDIWNPICEPIFSHGINNLKCALTGDLKIVRMDHCTSPAKGNKEIFVLVERVTKKNIKIRFFEVNDDDEQVWEGYAKFSELDVHHQYAIVFKTPEYTRTPNIDRPVKVYMELVRPSDGARSEWKEFKYVPNNEFKPGTNKRPRPYYSGSSYNTSSSLGSGEVPLPVINMPPPQQMVPTDFQLQQPLNPANSWNNSVPLLSQQEMNLALTDYSSEELERLYAFVAPDWEDAMNMPSSSNNVTDAPREISKRLGQIRLTEGGLAGMGYLNNLNHFMASDHPAKNEMDHSGVQEQGRDPTRTVVKMEVSPEDLSMARRTYDELMSFIKTKDAQSRAPDMLQKHLGEEDTTNAMHVFVGLNMKNELTFLLKMVVLFKKSSLLNVRNADLMTPLQLAVTCRNEEFVTFLMYSDANPCVADNKGRTALHVAIETMATPKMFESLLASRYAEELLEVHNYDGDTALFSAIEKRNIQAIKILCLKGADINKNHPKNGFTPLRAAIEAQYPEIVQYILSLPKLDMLKQADFQGITPYAAAHESKPEIMDLVTDYMTEKGLALELNTEIKDEESDVEADEDMEEEEFEIKSEIMSPEELRDLYQNVTKLTPECLDAVAAILDESHQYDNLADLLDLSHLISIMPSDQSISKNLLYHAIERENVKVIDIREFLANLDEHKAVEILDQMAVAAKVQLDPDKDLDIGCTPPKIRKAADLAPLDCIPDRLEELYENEYQTFMNWFCRKTLQDINETAVRFYFTEQPRSINTKTLWSKFCMLKAVFAAKHNIDMYKYKKVESFLKERYKIDACKRGATFDREQINRFLSDAPDEVYLLHKVVMVMAITWGCTQEELHNMTIGDIETRDGTMLITVRNRAQKQRKITIFDEPLENGVNLAQLLNKYSELRPKYTQIDSFFLQLQAGYQLRCDTKVVGKRKLSEMPSEIAKYLRLPDPEQYTGHTFRRTLERFGPRPL